MLNLEQLKIFVAAAEYGSFSAAALRLYMTQPNVSLQMRCLEGYLRSDLFTRRRYGVELTPPGRELLGHAREMLALAESAEAAVREAA